MKKLVLAVIVCGLSFAENSYADDAKVLPKNRWRLRLVSSFSHADQAFDSSGNGANLGDQYSQTIRMGFLTALRPEAKELVNTLNAIQPNSADNLPLALVNTDIDSSMFVNAFIAEYGLTDRLSLGVIVPMVYGEVNVKSSSSPSSEFQGLMNTFPEGHPMRAALASLQQQMSVESLSRTLESELGYDGGLSGWSGAGLGDIEVGGKYNYYKGHPFLATAKAGVRMPTGRRDDPDQLFDIGFGDGQFDIGAFHYVDYRALGTLDFTWELGYTAQLPHSATYRVPVVEGTDITPIKSKLNHNPGDYWETALEANLDFARVMTFSSKYRFVQKFSDSFSSSENINTATLETETSQLRHEANLRLAYSNLADVRAGRSRVPFELAAFYKAPFAGKNIDRLLTAGLEFKSYF